MPALHLQHLRLRRREEMKLLLKLAVILVWLPGPEGRWLQSLIDQKHGAPSSLLLQRSGAENIRRTEVADLLLSSSVRTRRSVTVDSHCRLHSVLLQVRDLGLGYESDEIVLFKYCSGTCPRLQSNHDLALNNLLLSGILPHPPSGERSAPCCRPTHHEDMAFLDNLHRWHKVEKLSAAGCSCVG